MARVTAESRNNPAKKMISWISQLLDDSRAQELGYPRPHWEVLREITKRFRLHKWRSFIVGGLIRDLVMSRGLQVPRDIDIVVCDIDIEELAHEFRDFTFVRRTRFGGLTFKHLDVLIDIWPLEKTYIPGSKSRPEIQDLPKYAFLDVEAIVLELYPTLGTERRVIEMGFTSAVITKTVEINYEPNPFPEISVIKAFRAALRLNLALGPLLVWYIQRKQWSTTQLMTAQRSHYGHALLNNSEINRLLTTVSKWRPELGPMQLSSDPPDAERIPSVDSHGLQGG